MAEMVRYEKDNQIARITLNNPEKLNTLVKEMHEELREKWLRAQADDDVKVIILSGEGRAFCAGASFGYVGTYYYTSGERKVPQRNYVGYDRYLMEREKDFMLCTKATIAQVHNYALGVGMRYAFYCDLMVCSEGTWFAYPEARMIGPYSPTLPYLYQKLGPALFMEVMLTGRWVSSEELYRRGVVNLVVPQDQLAETATKVAQSICALPADGLFVGKQAIHTMYEDLKLIPSMRWMIPHSVQVQQRLNPDEWNIFKARQQGSTRGAWESRDKRFEDLLPEQWKRPSRSSQKGGETAPEPGN